jgi:hypothetical protein
MRCNAIVLVGFAVLVQSVGCSGALESGLALSSKAAMHASPTSGFPDSDDAERERLPQGRELVAVQAPLPRDMPSPGRTNPFEFLGDSEASAHSESGNRKKEIRVWGFVHLDRPGVLLSVDGKSSVYFTGETVGQITVLEVSPPTVRLQHNGLSWQESLFRH